MTATDGTDDAAVPIGRRTLLAGAGATVLGGVASTSGALAGGDSAGTDASAGGTTGAQAAEGALTGALAWDANMDGRFTNRMQLDGDPAGGSRETAVHVTSGGERSRDAVGAVVDLRDRGLTLGEASENGAIAYDYYKASDATGRVPGELVVLLRTSDGSFVAAHRGTVTNASGQWGTRSVSRELATEPWRTVGLDGSLSNGLSGMDLGNLGATALDLLTQPADDVLPETFGAGTQLVAMAFGTGGLNVAVSDAYFDALRVGGEATAVPATVGMNVDFSPPRVQPGGGRLAATLSFANPAGGEQGLSLEDVDADTVQLSSYTPIAPATIGPFGGGTAARANRVRNVTGRGAAVEFDAAEVAGVLEGDGPTPVVVSGEFDVDAPYSFFAVGELEAGGRGRGRR